MATTPQTYIVTLESGTHTVEAVDAKAAKRAVAQLLGLKRLPAGARVESKAYLERTAR